MSWPFRVLFALMIIELAVLSFAIAGWLLFELVHWYRKTRKDERGRVGVGERGSVSAPKSVHSTIRVAYATPLAQVYDGVRRVLSLPS
jgi:hypothetical protein